jgi:hypothetical protein
LDEVEERDEDWCWADGRELDVFVRWRFFRHRFAASR